MSKRLFCLLTFGFISQNALADGHAVGIRLGMLGAGIEYSYELSERLTVRGALNGSSYSFDATKSGIDYDIDLGFDSFSIGVDFHPTKKALRLSIGAMRNDNSITATSRAADSVVVGDTTYSPDEIGTLTGVVSFDGTAPYAGIGWDWSRSKRIGLTLDFGVVRQGTPVVNLSADGPLLGDPLFAEDLAAEQTQLQDSLSDFDLYPYANMGFVIRF